MPRRKTETPILDEVRFAHLAAQRSGLIHGRNEMKQAILKLARDIENPGAQVLRLIQDIENITIIKK